MSVAQWIISIICNPPNSFEWSLATFSVSIVGTIVSTLHLIVILRRNFRPWSVVHLGYLIFIFMPYRVLYIVFGMIYDAPPNKIALEISLTGTLILVGWLQIYSTILIMRLWRVNDVFLGHPRCQRRHIPVEELMGLMQSLGYCPSTTQIVELMAVFAPDSSEISFNDFCLALERWSILQSHIKSAGQRKTPKQTHAILSLQDPLIPDKIQDNSII